MINYSFNCTILFCFLSSFGLYRFSKIMSYVVLRYNCFYKSFALYIGHARILGKKLLRNSIICPLISILLKGSTMIKVNIFPIKT